MTEQRNWQLASAGQQQQIYEQFGNYRWTSIPRSNTPALNTNISFALYHTPYEECSTDQGNVINATRRKVLELSGSGDVHFGFAIVNVLLEDNRSCIFPLIRTRQTNGQNVYFVEAQPGRVYTGWTDFLENHKLPKCAMCFPSTGFYQSRVDGRVDIRFDRSAGCGSTLDTASTVVRTASACLLTASFFFPLATPIVLGATAAAGVTTTISTVRGGAELRNRRAHYESLSLSNEQARDIWLRIGVDGLNTIFLGASAVLPRLVAGSTAVAIIDVLNFASVGVNTFGLIVNIAVIVDRFRKGTFERRDISYVIGSFLFLGNIVINAAIAEKVIKQLSNQPSQLCNLFNKVSNRVFCDVNTMSVAITPEQVWQKIGLEIVVPYLKEFGMDHTAQLVQKFASLIMRFNRGVLDRSAFCIELCRALFDLLGRVLEEVAEAWKVMRNFISLVPNLFNGPSLHVAEIYNITDRVLPDANTVSISRDTLIRTALEVAIRNNPESQREFSSMYRLVVNDIRRRYDQRMTLEVNQRGQLSLDERNRLLREAMDECRAAFQINGDDALENAPQRNDAPLLPFFSWNDFYIYVFQINAQPAVIDNFIDETAGTLFNDVNYLDSCRRITDGPISIYQHYGSTLIFYHEPLPDTDTNIGFVLLRN